MYCFSSSPPPESTNRAASRACFPGRLVVFLTRQFTGYHTPAVQLFRVRIGGAIRRPQRALGGILLVRLLNGLD